MKKIIVSVVILVLSQSFLSAQFVQNKSVESSGSTEEFFQSLVKRQLIDYNKNAVKKVKAFRNYISYISDPEMSLKTKKEAMKNALSLFLNDDIIVYDTTLLMENIGHKTAIQINEYLNLVLEKSNSEVIVKWNNIYSQEDFDTKTGVKIVKADQVIIYSDNYLVDEFYTSNKLINTHLVLETNNTHGVISELHEIKLGTISF